MKKQQIICAAIMIVISLALVFSVDALCGPEPISYAAGTYYGVAKGNHEGLWVKVDVSEDTILAVEIIENHETVGICEPALEAIPGKIVQYQGTAVEAISGATNTSNGIKEAAASALLQAQGKAEKVTYTPPAPKADPVPLTYKYKAGEYTAKAEGFESDVNVKVTFSADRIEKVEIVKCLDTAERVEMVKASVPDDIIKWQTYDVDGATGATFTSQGLKDAVQKCVEQAKK